jgi:hypothetical protein
MVSQVGTYLGKRRHGDVAGRPLAAHVRWHRVRSQWCRSRTVLEDVRDDVDGLRNVLEEVGGAI